MNDELAVPSTVSQNKPLFGHTMKIVMWSFGTSQSLYKETGMLYIPDTHILQEQNVKEEEN